MRLQQLMAMSIDQWRESLPESVGPTYLPTYLLTYLLTYLPTYLLTSGESLPEVETDTLLGNGSINNIIFTKLKEVFAAMLDAATLAGAWISHLACDI